MNITFCILKKDHFGQFWAVQNPTLISTHTRSPVPAWITVMLTGNEHIVHMHITNVKTSHLYCLAVLFCASYGLTYYRWQYSLDASCCPCTRGSLLTRAASIDTLIVDYTPSGTVNHYVSPACLLCLVVRWRCCYYKLLVTFSSTCGTQQGVLTSFRISE